MAYKRGKAERTSLVRGGFEVRSGCHSEEGLDGAGDAGGRGCRGCGVVALGSKNAVLMVSKVRKRMGGLNAVS